LLIEGDVKQEKKGDFVISIMLLVITNPNSVHIIQVLDVLIKGKLLWNSKTYLRNAWGLGFPWYLG